MRIPTREIPQADSLGALLTALASIGRGASTYQDIAQAIGMDERQGRYYRLASELFGFAERVGRNEYRLTPLGQQLVSAGGSPVAEIVAEGVLGSHVMQRLLPFLESRSGQGFTREELEVFVASVIRETGRTMVPRRTSTLIAWLNNAGLLAKRGNRYYFRGLPANVPVVEYATDSEPLIPPSFALSEYSTPAEQIATRARSVNALANPAAAERAVRSHRELVQLVAARIRSAGAIPRCNSYIDLAATVHGESFIFEMKSTTKRNARDQVRSGVAQLYEYRYLQKAPSARLVLVIEKPLPADLGWMKDYLITERSMGLVWDGNGPSLHWDSRQDSILGFLR